MSNINNSLLILLESVLGPGRKKAHSNYAFRCPKCYDVRKSLGKSNTPKLEIQLETSIKGENRYNCWYCSEFRGKTIKSLFKKLKVAPSKIEELNRIIRPSSHLVESSDELSLPKEFISLSEGKNSLVINRALTYLKNRGIDQLDIIKYNIGFCSEGKYSDRIIIPSYDENHNLNYFTGRSINNSSNLKYLNPKVDRSNIIPFEFYINWNEPIIICEGMFDSVTIKRNAIPLLGKTFSEALMKKIVTSQVEKVYIALDKDAIKLALKYVEMLLSKGKEVYLVELNEKDPNQIGFKSFTELIQNTFPITFKDLLIKKLEQ